MTDIADFTFNTSTIRVVTVEGEPWFVAADIAAVLGFPRTDHMIRAVSKDERGNTPHSVRGVDGKFRIHGTVSESGLYKLIMRSDKPEAKPFQDWVTKVVLPAIRKDGGYVAGEEKLAAGEMDGAAFARLVDEMVEKSKKMRPDLSRSLAA